jgi:adenylate cyclase class 2
MAIETEIKYRVNSAQSERVLKDLREFNATYIGEDFEENIIYGGGNLPQLNAILRIRKIGETTLLTFKKNLTGKAGIKEHIEHETIVKDASELEMMLEELGFSKCLIYEKRRKTWHFRKVEIVLDELPFGSFMEIEGTFLSIKEAEMLLGADEFDTEYKTYPRLTSELGKKNGDLIEARF